MSRRVSLNRRATSLNDNDANLTEEQLRRRARKQLIFSIIQTTVFLIIWAFMSILLIITPTHNTPELLVPLKAGVTEHIEIEKTPKGAYISIEAVGYIDVDATNMPGLASEDQKFITVTVVSKNTESIESRVRSSNAWKIYLDVSSENLKKVKKYISLAGQKSDSKNKMLLSLLNNHDKIVALSLFINANPLDQKKGAIIGFVLLIFLYTLIIWDLTDRTFAALLSATAAIGCLCFLDERPSLNTLMKWIDIDTLMLLFGMMLMVEFLSETGIFDYLSVFVYAFSKGKIWRLLFFLYMLTALFSAILDNATMVLLLVPITIRLCETLALRTTTVLTCVAIFSNLGGCLTPVGDHPNFIISTDPYVHSQGIHFGIFTLHMFPGVLISLILAFFMLYFMTRNKITKLNNSQIDLSITSLQKLADQIKDKNSAESKEVEIRIAELKMLMNPGPIENNYEETLAKMRSKYKIKNKILLIECCIALCFALILFFTHSLPFMHGATLSWTALLAAILLLILVNRPDIDGLLENIEWTTLIFFGALFVFTEALVQMGFMDWISERIGDTILVVEEKYQLTVGILLILWISAITSAVVDNVPVTTMLLKLTVDMSKNKKLNLPLTPLIWALAFGAGFGGNGTIIGASANVMTAALASQYGYKINFRRFFIIGFPVMIMTMVVITIYLLLAHAALTWH